MDEHTNTDTAQKPEITKEALLDAVESTQKVKETDVAMEDKDEDGVGKRTFDKNKTLKQLVFLYGVGMCLFHIYAKFFGYINNYSFYALHWTLGMVLIYMLYPMRRKSPRQRPSVVDIVFIAAAIFACWDICKDPNGLSMRITYHSMTVMDYIAAVCVCVVSWEAARRSVGWALPCVALVFFLYAWKGNIIPGYMGSKGYSISRILTYMLSTDGVFGSSVRMSAEYLYLMILFGAFLHVSGAGEFFIRFALSLTGHSRGGPAKVAVVSSCLFGSVSGSAISNVIGTGAFTIPLMKKTGYKSEFAGAVEAVASTGGQLMPPVMGTGAFLMVELTGISYARIALCALIPALLYYISLFVSVDLEAQRLGLRGIPREELESFKKVMKEGWQMLLPLLVLITTLGFLRWSVRRAAVAGIIACVAASWFRKETHMGWRKILDAMALGSVRALTIISCVGCAGLVISCIMVTGLGNKFTFIVTAIAGSSGFLALLLAAFAALILGMGLPTLASYLVVASVLNSALVSLGFSVIGVNMFLFFFACLSCITPPVALAAFAAANVAECSPNKVGWTAVKLGLVAFIVPFLFVYDNALLLIGGFWPCVQVAITSLIGVFFFSVAIYGWFMSERINPLLRLITFAGALCMVIPGTLTDVIGAGCILLFAMLHKPLRNKVLQITHLKKMA